MKFVISRQELNYLIGKCYGVVGGKNTTLPIIANVLVEASNNMVTMTATDLLVGVRCRTECKVLEEGRTTIPTQKLRDLAKELTAMNVEVTTNENHITLFEAGTSRFQLPGIEPSEYPSLPDLDGAVQVKVPKSELKKAFFSSSFAVAKDDNRHELMGLFMKVENNRAIFTGTDGKQLAKCYVPLDFDPSFTGDFIIPKKAADEIGNNIEEDGEATLFLMQDKIAVETDNSILITKLISGAYPDIDSVIPKNPNIKVALHCDELTSILRQVLLFTDKDSHSARFTFANGEMKLNANQADKGEGKVSMPANYHGAPIEVSFNTSNLLNILTRINEDSIEFGLVDAYNPAVITDFHLDKEVSEPSPLFVLMPMRCDQ